MLSERMIVDGRSVTVVIPTKNRRKLLDRAISSVLRQEDVDVTVVVVDDGSEDGTAEHVADHSDQRVQLVRHQESKGVSLARNAGLALVTTPWVSFLDDDDIWSPIKLRNQLAALECADGHQWAVSAAARIDDDNGVLAIQYPVNAPMIAALLRLNVVPGGGSGVLAATELVRELGGFDEDLSNLADWDMWIRLAQRSEPAAVMDADVGYYLHGGSMSLDLDRSRVERAQMVHKYEDLYEQYAAQNNFADWHNYLGDMWMTRGRWREALREYRLAGLRGASTGVVATKITVAAVSPNGYAWLRNRRRRGKPPVPGAAVVQEWLQDVPTGATLGNH